MVSAGWKRKIPDYREIKPSIGPIGFARARLPFLAYLFSAILATASADTLYINEFVASNATGIQDEDGDFPDWIEFFNQGDHVLDLEDYGLSDDPEDPFLWRFPSVEIQPGGFLLVFASGKDRVGSELHANFKIKTSGEPLLLSNATGQVLDSLDTGILWVDISRGRVPDGSEVLYYFDDPTPGLGNLSTAYLGRAGRPEFETEPGFYMGSCLVDFDSDSNGSSKLRYTLDGSPPTLDSDIFVEAIQIDTTTVMRAIATADSMIPSLVLTGTFFVDEVPTLPVISLATDPDNLWDEETGIYVMGPDADPNWPYEGANFWENWERPVHFELFSESQAHQIHMDAGIKIHGGASRTYPQKSLRVIARDAYGDDEIDFPLFEMVDEHKYKAFVLRNAGQDFARAHIRDMMATKMAWDSGLEVLGYRPMLVFLNGVYWGIYNMRERLDEHYFEYHFGLEKEDLIFLADQGWQYFGDPSSYLELRYFIESHDLSDSLNYAHVAERFDIENFIQYNVFELFISNQDWPDNNRRYWKSTAPESRWRWIFQDMDKGLEWHTYYYDQIDRATNPDSTVWGIPGWATVELRSLLENEGFRRDFVNAFADRLNSDFSYESVCAQLDEVSSWIEEEIPRHREFWSDYWEFQYTWEYEIELIEYFEELRVGKARLELQTNLDLGEELLLNLDVEPCGAGHIELTCIEVDSTWSGIYFEGTPIPVRAVPSAGYVFDHWSDTTFGEGVELMLEPTSEYSLTAVFEFDGSAAATGVINEINYNSHDDFDPGDWVEIHNPSDHALELDGWEFRDEDDDHRYFFPQGCTIPARGYLVLCADIVAFQNLFPEVEAVVGNLGFGLSGSGELIRLYDDSSDIVDWVNYSDSPPWPTEPDGNGPTLELKNPCFDNCLPDSWAASAEHGTPGGPNGVSVSVDGNVPTRLALGACYPNPFNARATLTFDVPSRQHLRLRLYDIQGRKLAEFLDAHVDAGRHELPVNMEGFSSGIYLLVLRAPEEKLGRRIVLIK